MGVIAFLGGLLIWALAHFDVFAAFHLSSGVQTILGAVAALASALGARDVIGDGSGIVAFLDSLGTGWKTFVGAILFVLGQLLSPEVFATLPATWATLLTFVGAVLTALGIYHKVAIRAGRSKLSRG
jgi:hypothetical protein